MSAGRWYAEGLAILADVHGVACPIACVMPGPNAERNARLLAAAPELLAQLLALLRDTLDAGVERDPTSRSSQAEESAARLIARLTDTPLPAAAPRGGRGGSAA